MSLHKAEHGQITAFIILAIVIMVLFVGMMLIVSQVKQQRLKVTKEQFKVLLAKENQYSTYITSCLDQATKKSLWALGYQGGVIYTTQAPLTKTFMSQPGKFYLPFMFRDYEGNDVTYNVSYGIVKPRFESGSGAVHLEPPFYPYAGTLVSDPSINNPTFISMLGNFPQPGPFTPLCNSLGLNAPLVPNAPYTCGNYEASYDTSNAWDTASVQEYLENYIVTQVKDCIKLENLPDLVDWNVTYGNASVIVAFSDDFVYSFLNYSLAIFREREEQTLTLDTFSVKEPVRLRQIHELLHAIIKRDTQDIFFDSVADASTLNTCTEISGSTNCLKLGMRVMKFRNVCPATACSDGQYDDILAVEDSGSMLDGMPYRFQIAVQNRHPALDYIESHPSFTLADGRKALLVFPGDELSIGPKGYDPDEDNAGGSGFMEGMEGVNVYGYGGWREEYVDTFNLEAWKGTASDSRLGRLEIITTEDLTALAPHNFTLSPNYQTTQRTAAFRVNGSDYGLHTFRVMVSDDGGLQDYQKIYVYVPPEGELLSYTIYPEIKSGITSLEDEITLKASLNPLQLRDRITFDVVKGVDTVIATRSSPEITLSGVVLGSGQTTLKVQTKDVMNIIIPLPTNDLTITVVPCIPHRSPVPPAPFNDFALEKYHEANPKLANHACCNGDPNADIPTAQSTWQLAAPTTLCYDKEFVGNYNDVSVEIPGAGAPVGATATPDSTKQYKRIIRFSCSAKSYECNAKNIDVITPIP